MPISYTNRKGSTFFLCQGETKTGKVCYYFAREPKGKEINEMPPGYKINESVNGVVSLVKIRPRMIKVDDDFYSVPLNNGIWMDPPTTTCQGIMDPAYAPL